MKVHNAAALMIMIRVYDDSTLELDAMGDPESNFGEIGDVLDALLSAAVTTAKEGGLTEDTVLQGLREIWRDI